MKDIFNSPRFWLLVATAGLQALVVVNVINGVQAEGLVQIIQALLIGIVGIRTIDRNIGDAKAGVTTVSMPTSVNTVTATTEKTPEI